MCNTSFMAKLGLRRVDKNWNNLLSYMAVFRSIKFFFASKLFMEESSLNSIFPCVFYIFAVISIKKIYYLYNKFSVTYLNYHFASPIV